MGKKNENYRLDKEILIDRLLKENNRLAHENVKLQNDIKVLKKKNTKLNKFIQRMMNDNDDSTLLINSNKIE